MTQAAEALPDDPETLKAMLIAERLRAERLVAIIKELQRHRFGPRAESLPEDQLLLALEDVEAGEAEAAEAKSPTARAEGARKRRVNRGALPAHLPRVETLVDVEDKTCPCCKGALHRIGEDVSERLDVVPAQFRVLVVRRPKYACRACESGGVQSPAPAPRGGRPAGRGDGGPCAGLQIRRSFAALSPGADLRAPGPPPRPLDTRQLGRTRRVPFAAGARAGARADQDRPALGLCAGRSALGRKRPTGGRLCLRA